AGERLQHADLVRAVGAAARQDDGVLGLDHDVTQSGRFFSSPQSATARQRPREAMIVESWLRTKSDSTDRSRSSRVRHSCLAGGWNGALFTAAAISVNGSKLGPSALPPSARSSGCHTRVSRPGVALSTRPKPRLTAGENSPSDARSAIVRPHSQALN